MIELSYDADADFLVLRVTGHVAWEEVYRAVNEKIAAENISPSVDLLIDLRQFDMPNLTYENLRPVASKRRDWNDIRAKSRSAYVVRSEIEEQIVELLRALSIGAIRGEERTFLNFDEARNWLLTVKNQAR